MVFSVVFEKPRFPLKNCGFQQKSVVLAQKLESRGLDLPSSKVFQTEDQKYTAGVHQHHPVGLVLFPIRKPGVTPGNNCAPLRNFRKLNFCKTEQKTFAFVISFC